MASDFSELELTSASPGLCGTNISDTDNSTMVSIIRYLKFSSLKLTLDPSESAKTKCLYELLSRHLAFHTNPDDILPDALPNSVIVTFIVLYVIIILLAVVGNIIVIVIIGFPKVGLSVTEMFILSLAVSDLLIAFVNMPFQLYFIIANEWLAGNVGLGLCKFTNYIQGVTVVASVMTLTAIAIDRYIVICHPLLSRKIHQTKAAVGGIVAIWIVALSVVSPHLVFQGLDKKLKVETRHGSLGPAGIGYICAEFYPRGRLDAQVYSVCIYAFFYCIPVAVMSYTYGAIAHRLWVRQPVAAMLENPRYYGRNVAQKRRITKMLIVLVLISTVLWFPFFTFTIYKDFSDDVNSLRIHGAVLQLIGYSNCCANPIVYTFLNKNFQQEFVRRCCRRPRRIEVRQQPIANIHALERTETESNS